MIVALDVDYRDGAAVTACVGFERFTDAAPRFERVVRASHAAAEYEPGRFYLRELPYLLDAIERLEALPSTCVVDGYVWLGPERAGLGAHLHERLGRKVAVIGVAKTPFHGARAIEVLRGKSARPLFVTAVGVDPALAAREVRSMHGAHRIPTLLRRVDALARGTATPSR